MRRLLASRLHWPLSRWLMLLSWRSQRTGRRYTTPVSYVAEGRNVYVTSGARWWRNFVGDGDVRVCLAGNWRTGRATPVTGADASREQHERLFRERPLFRRLAGIPGTPKGGPMEPPWNAPSHQAERLSGSSSTIGSPPRGEPSKNGSPSATSKDTARAPISLGPVELALSRGKAHG